MSPVKFSILLLFLSIASLTGRACPADPSQQKYVKLDDGTIKMVRLTGDEYGHFWKAIDDGRCYRQLYGAPDRYVEVSEADERRKAAARRAEVQKRATKVTRSGMGYPCTKQNLKGKKRMLVILVNFKDKAFSEQNARAYRDIFNATNYHEGRFTGSVKDYFLAQSNNQMELDFDVVGPVEVSRNSSYYGAQTSTRTNAHAAEMVREAIQIVDNKVDFSLYDNDNDGVVDEIAVIYAGLDQAAGGSEDDIWAHQGTVMSYCDQKIINYYACASENHVVNGVTCLNGIGMICHEMSHCFGLPDTYDTVSGNYGTNRWDLMGIGVYNDNSYTPAGYTGFDKMFCLWQFPVVLRDSQRVSGIRPMSEGGDFYLIPNDGCDDEFYLLENRQQTGCDTKLPGHGMLITHVDYDETLFDNNVVNKTGKIGNFTNDHERISVVLADNDVTEDISDYNVWVKCMQGDLFPDGENNSLTNTSMPHAKLYHQNIDESFLLSKPVTDISEDGDGMMSFRFTNDITAQHHRHLTDLSGKIRVISETEAKLLVCVKNTGNVNYSGKIGAFVYTKVKGQFILQKTCEMEPVSMETGETKEFEFMFDQLKDNTNYYVFFNFLKEEDSTEWTQSESAYPFNLRERNTFTITMDEKSMRIKKNGNSVTITATFHNESCNPYTKYIGLFTYFLQDGLFKIQKPNTYPTANIEPYGEQRLTFTLDNLNDNVNLAYLASFYYYPDDSNTWKQLSGYFPILPDQAALLGDANGDHVVNITDAIVIVDYVLGRVNSNFVFVNSDLDKNGIVNITDALSVVDIVLGRTQ